MFRLCVVTDRNASNGRTESETAEMSFAGGADAVQLRMKNDSGRRMLEEALSIRAVADAYSKMFIVNDRVDIAVLSNADGVHLGQSDIPLAYARNMLGDGKLIGITVHTVEEAVRAENEGADYVSIGSVFRTSTKHDALQEQGLDVVSAVRRSINIPLIAIGGINLKNVPDVLVAGADGVAVVSAVVSEDDISEAVRKFVNIMSETRANI